LTVLQSSSGGFGQDGDPGDLICDTADHQKATLPQGRGQIYALALPCRQEQTAFRWGERVRDQIGQQRSVPIRIEHAAKTSLGGPGSGRGADSEDRPIMQKRGTGSDRILARQQGRCDVIGSMDVPGNNRQDRCDDGDKTDRGQSDGGLGGAGLWSGYQNAFQKTALVKEPPVDDGWRGPNTWLSYYSMRRHENGRQAAVDPGPGTGWNGTMKPVLGIETSCDETAAAVVDGEGRILAEVVLSQLAEHAPFGGVVPEIAARTHLRYLSEQVRRAMGKAGLEFSDLGGVAATSGPGLIGGLIVGSQFAKGIAIANRLPFVAVNHLEAHALTARLPGLVEGGAPFPYLLLLLSGGHSQCIAVIGVGQHVRLGGTIDDAVGEAFDKVAKLLGLDWPGGPALERIAAEGDPTSYALPRPMLRRPGCELSFSGLKTAVAQTILRIGPNLTRGQHADVAASFQRAVVDVLADRAGHAMDMMRERFPQASLLVVAGGVASNASVRAGIALAVQSRGFRLVAPPVRLCSDNAVMVAWAGVERLLLGWSDSLDAIARPRWPLDTLEAVSG
jgi:N6-L-threonylcarbamoyladenine synthase